MVLTVWVPERLNHTWKDRFCQGILIQHQSYHDDYVCSFGGVAMSGGDGMDFSTRVCAARGAWVLAVLSYCMKH
jgi:hypothetical protein